MARGLQRGFPGNRGARPPYTGSWRYRRPYVRVYFSGVPYGLPGYGWAGPYYPWYPDGGYDDSAAPAGDASEGYEAEPQYQGLEQHAQLPPRSEPARSAPGPGSEQTVMLIFKDGRPVQQIHNYVLTRTTLYVGDEHHRAIPTDQLDLDATADVNRNAGVEFQLPDTPR